MSHPSPQFLLVLFLAYCPRPCTQSPVPKDSEQSPRNNLLPWTLPWKFKSIYPPTHLRFQVLLPGREPIAQRRAQSSTRLSTQPANEGHAQSHTTFNDNELSIKTILASTFLQLTQTPQPRMTPSSAPKAKGMQFLGMLEDRS